MTTIRHVLRVVRRSKPWLALGAAGPLLLAIAPNAGAQGFGPDPFRPYNSQYDSAVFPIAPGPMSAFGNTMLNQNQGGVRGANQFENYLESIGDGRGGARRYDQANRAYDRQFGRQYQPNRKADAGFQERQEEVSELYFRYLREQDPRKRAELLREYKLARGRATRQLSVGARNARSPRTARPGAEGALNGQAREFDERPDLDYEPGVGRESGVGAARSPAARRAAPGRAAPSPDIPAAPPTGSADGRTRGRSPSQILDRAMESEIPPAPSLPRSGAGGSTTPAPPPVP